MLLNCVFITGEQSTAWQFYGTFMHQSICDLAAPPAGHTPGHLGFSTFGGRIPPPSHLCEIY